MPDSRLRQVVTVIAPILYGLVGSHEALAQEKGDAESRLRAALRQATVQLRDLEDQNATLLAKQAEAERNRLELAQKLASDEKELEALRRQTKTGLAALQQAGDAQKENLEKWETAYKGAADIARTRDADAKRLDAALLRLREQTRICEAKNAELYKLGEELLDLYDNKGILGIIAASEPVTKLKRVEYENVMQDYEDKLHNNEIVPPAP